MRRRLVIMALVALGGASPLLAQQTGQLVPGQPDVRSIDVPEHDTHLLASKSSTSGESTEPTLVNESSSASTPAQSSSSAQSKSNGDDSGWHVVIAPYLWFPGVHGTVGAAGRQLSVHASPGDLLSNFRFGLMGAAEIRYKRLLLPVDFMWVRLEDDKPLPLEEAVISANLKAQQFILTPKIGYLLIDEDKLKIAALTGFRYWHLGEDLKFNPSALGLSFSDSQNWVDPLVGGRILVALAPKVAVTVLGDVGGWGTGSRLDYQFTGLLGFKIKPRWTLQAGYRYMGVDYRNGGFVFNIIQSGAIFGVTFKMK